MRSLAVALSLLGLSTVVLAEDAPATEGEVAPPAADAAPADPCAELEGEALSTCRAEHPEPPAAADQAPVDAGKTGKAGKALKAKSTGNMEDFGGED